MSGSNVQSIQALRDLRVGIIELAHHWDLSAQQIRFTQHHIEEHFTLTLPAYWRQETRKAEQRLAEAMDNLSRQQGNATDGNAPALTEAKQRVVLCRRRLATCEEKMRASKRIAIQMIEMSKELAGPLSELTGIVSTQLPQAADVLNRWIGHLEQYAEIRPMASSSPPSPLALESPPQPIMPSAIATSDTLPTDKSDESLAPITDRNGGKPQGET